MDKRTIFLALSLTAIVTNTAKAQSEMMMMDIDSTFVSLFSQFDDIIVTGERPAMKVEPSRLTYDISRMAEIKMVSNAYESLLQLPRITEDDGTLTLAGANSLSIIINGKLTSTRPTTLTVTGRWLDSDLTLQALHNHARCDEFFDISFDHSKWTFRGILRNNITLSSKPDIRMELLAMALSETIQGSYTVGDFWMLNAGLRWNSSNRKASIIIKADDIFGTGQGEIKLRTRNMGQYLNMTVNNYYQGIDVSFTYKFGGYKEKKHKEVDTSRFK